MKGVWKLLLYMKPGSWKFSGIVLHVGSLLIDAVKDELHHE